jgi:hypothetical protein
MKPRRSAGCQPVVIADWQSARAPFGKEISNPRRITKRPNKSNGKIPILPQDKDKV